VTFVPPVWGPEVGESDTTVGRGALYAKLVFEVVGDVPAAVWTVTATVPTP
jgi:hypothetical protein